jgi:hypothetical protein
MVAVQGEVVILVLMITVIVIRLYQDKPVALATHVVVVNIKTKQVNNLVKNATQDNTKIRQGGYLVKNVRVVIQIHYIQVILVRQNVTVLIHQVFVHLGLIASGK